MQKLSGITSKEEYLKTFELRNLLSEWPGYSSSGKGDLFPIHLAKQSACSMLSSLRNRHVILLGRGAAEAFGIGRNDPLLCWIHKHSTTWAIFPHPSGVSRWWNRKENVLASSEFLRAAITERISSNASNRKCCSSMSKKKEN